MTQPPPYPGEIGPDPLPLSSYGQQPPPSPYSPPYGQQPPHWQMVPRQLNPLRGLAAATAITAGVYTLLLIVVAALAFPAEQDLIEDELAFTAYDVVGLLMIPVLIAVFIVTSLWLSKARENAEMLRPEVRHARSSGWAWGGWLVPIVGLWFPFQVVRDVNAERNDSPASSLVGWWWATFLVSFSLSSVTDAAAYGTGAMAEMAVASAAATLVSLVLWIQVIRTITDKRSAQQA